MACADCFKDFPKAFLFFLLNWCFFHKSAFFKAFPVVFSLEPIDRKLISNSPSNQRFYSQIPSYILRKIINYYRSMCWQSWIHAKRGYVKLLSNLITSKFWCHHGFLLGGGYFTQLPPPSRNPLLFQSDQSTFLGLNKYQKGDFTISVAVFYQKLIFNP